VARREPPAVERRVLSDWDSEELERHRVTGVRTLKIRTRWPRLLGRNATFEEHGFGRELLVRQVVTDKGASGWGISRRLRPEQTPKLTGRRISELFDPAVGVTAEEAMPLDFALHDLAGAILGVPVHQMLGGAGDPAVPVYGAATYMDDITPAYHPGGVQVVVRHCHQDWELGYRGFKIKIGRGYRWMEPPEGLRRDIEVTRAVRDRFPDAQLMVDANNTYSCDDFLRYFRAVADCNLHTIEEPFHENRDDLLRLREAIKKLNPATTVTEGESRADVEFLLQLGEEGLVDILNLDIEGFGFTPWRRLAPRAVERGLLLSPHAFDLKLKTFYGAQFLAGVGNACPLEGVIDQTEGVDMGLYEFQEGVLHVPDAPGLGMKLVWGRAYDDRGRDDSGHKLMM
jgi:L-alanine-DL-glutamate epimerase-like enolase superfamily enzyme